MCKDCKKITIPIGPKGDPGPAGANGNDGATGPQGPAGPNGTNGINGTNAFKFVKELKTTEADQTIIISFDEITSCTAIPQGCFGRDTVGTSRVDIHVQLWLHRPGIPDYWELLRLSTTGSIDTYSAKVIPSLDQLVITTATNYGTYRLVVLG